MKDTKNPFIIPELSAKELSKELYRVNLLLQEKNDALEQSELKRRALFNNISHDLRSPITAINSHVEYLLSFDDFSVSEVHEELKTVKERIKALESMINEIFTMTTLDEIDFSNVNLTKVNILEYLNNIKNIYLNDRRYSDRIMSFQLDIEPNIFMNIEPDLFRRALDNLFSNALKFTTSQGELQFEAKMTSDELLTSLKDNGIGIAPEHISKLFDRSYQVDNARTPGSNAGCGLGLSIVKSIIDHHNGKVWCESQVNEGSTFFISIPLTQH